MITYSFAKGVSWVRVFGRGFSVTNHKQIQPLFSERYGYTKALHVGSYCFKWLAK